MPWNNNLQERYEFRIFVVNYKLVGASQQNTKQLYSYSSKELKMIEKALNNITFLTTIPYINYIADVYCHNGICYLIEVNPFGAHSGAGSSLFHWIDDYKLLHGYSDPELRYLSIINL
jgi:hypothetical protein